MKKRVLAGLAFVAAALALILILSIFRSTARAVENEPAQVGFLLIAGTSGEDFDDIPMGYDEFVELMPQLKEDADI